MLYSSVSVSEAEQAAIEALRLASQHRSLEAKKAAEHAAAMAFIAVHYKKTWRAANNDESRDMFAALAVESLKDVERIIDEAPWRGPKLTSNGLVDIFQPTAEAADTYYEAALDTLGIARPYGSDEWIRRAYAAVAILEAAEDLAEAANDNRSNAELVVFIVNGDGQKPEHYDYLALGEGDTIPPGLKVTCQFHEIVGFAPTSDDPYFPLVHVDDLAGTPSELPEPMHRLMVELIQLAENNAAMEEHATAEEAYLLNP